MPKKKKVEATPKTKKKKVEATSTKRKKKIVEIDAVIIAPRFSMCDGKKKRLEEKIKEQNGIRSL